MNLRVTRRINLGGRSRLELTAESFNLFNRDNNKLGIGDHGYWNAAGQFVVYPKQSNYPAYYQQPTSFMKAMSAYSPRQIQVAARLQF
jgi:hypothetical protein